MNDSTVVRWDVFVSYSRSDSAIAKRLVEDFAAADLTVWYDESSIPAASRVRERINEGIASSSAFVIVISRRSLRSAWVLNELDSAMLREIAESRDIVLPVLIGRVDPRELPADIQGKKFIDLRNNFDRQYAIQQRFLIASIRSALNPAPTSPGDVTLKIGNELLDYILTTYSTGGNRGPSVGSLESAKREADRIAENMAEDMQERTSDQLGADDIGIVYVLEEFGILALKRLMLFYFVRYRLDPDNYSDEEALEMLKDALGTALLFFIESVGTEFSRASYVTFRANLAPTVWDAAAPS